MWKCGKAKIWQMLISEERKAREIGGKKEIRWMTLEGVGKEGKMKKKANDE